MPVPDAALPRAFALSRLGYYADFVLAPVVALGLIWDFWISGRPLAHLAVTIPLGALGWELAEYLIHRFAFHGPLHALHDVHHRRPAALVGIASWGTFAAFAAAWLAVATLCGVPNADGALAGVLLAYLFYIAIHDRMHHADRTTFGRYVAFMFALHGGHHRGGHWNFGVSSPLFDFVFRTYRSPRRDRPRG